MDYANEETLIRGIRNREDAAFEYLHRKCFYQILSISKVSGGDEEDAKDLYNDGILILIREIDKEKEMTCSVSTLLYSICYKKNDKAIRKQRSRNRYLDEADEEPCEEQFEEQLDAPILESIFWSSFRKLKENCQVIIRKVLVEIPMQIIAGDLKLSREAARQRKLRCQRALIGIIQANPEYISLRRNDEIPNLVKRIKKL